MDEDIFQLISEFPLEMLFPLMTFGMLRTLGMSYSFLPFGWGMGQGVTLRLGLAFVMGAPIMLAEAALIVEMSRSYASLELSLLAAKEFAIGFGLGLLASGPFRALQYAGGIVDSFRGESDSGIQAPDGSPLQTLSLLYLVIGFSVFFAMDGLWLMIANIYQTYAIWPIDARLPSLYGGSAEIALLALDGALQLGLVIVAPIMLLLGSVEIILMVATKVAKRFNLYELSFLLKNLLTLLTLVIMTALILRVAETNFLNIIGSVSIMETYFSE